MDVIRYKIKNNKKINSNEVNISLRGSYSGNTKIKNNKIRGHTAVFTIM